MSQLDKREPRLKRLYLRYLDTEDPAGFIKSLAESYTLGTLSRLAVCGDRIGRRSAVLALGFLGDFSVNHVLGMALRDDDRGVRVIAENGIREIWRRDGSIAQRQKLDVIFRYNSTDAFEMAESLASEMIQEAPWFAEAWNQRAIARFQREDYQTSVEDCRQTLERNPYHFPAAVGMAHCFLELGDAFSALECFRRSLRLNPDLEGVRTQVEYLQKTLGGP